MGIGLHTGQKATITFKPAKDNEGFKFRRVDLEGKPYVNADVYNVVDTSRGTTLEQNGARVHTTEHVLAAAYGLELDNLIMELDGPEVPIMDGSAATFVEVLKQAGMEEQQAEKEYFVITENLTYEDTERQTEMLAVPQVLEVIPVTPGNVVRLDVLTADDRFRAEYLRELETVARGGHQPRR